MICGSSSPLEEQCLPQAVEMQTILPTSAMGLCLLLATLSAVYLKKKSTKASQKLQMPPLVPGCPLLGNIFGMDTKRPHVTLTEWSLKHGDIYTIKILREKVVVLNSIEHIREALRNNDFAGRPSIYRINYGFHYAKDIIFGTYSSKWAYMKKVAAKGLKSFGTGQESVDKVLGEEIAALTGAFQEHAGGQFDPRITLMTAVVNGITATVTGKRYDHTDPRMLQYKLTTRLFSESCSCVEGMELDLFPWLRHFRGKTIRKLDHARAMLDKLIDEELREVKARHIPGEPGCILDLLLDERSQHCASEHTLTEEDIRCVFIDLLVAGTFTTAVALSSFVIMMMHLPRLQNQLQADIAKHIGRQRAPCPSDRDKLPLMEATILEIFRYLSHVPLNLPHYTLNDTMIGGYSIPKHTQVLLNLWAVHHDDRLWDDPWTFKPDRFLDSQGKLLPPSHQNRKNLIPFSAGRRACLGENISRERLFLFCTSLIQKFTFAPPDGTTLVSPDPRDFDLGLILEPKPYSVKVLPRK